MRNKRLQCVLTKQPAFYFPSLFLRASFHEFAFTLLSVTPYIDRPTDKRTYPMKKSFLLITGFILFAALFRLIPHAYNFTPIGAIALFGAAYFTDKKWALIIPLGAMWISDLLLNNLVYASFYSGFTLFTPGFLFIYGGIVLIAVLGFYLFKKVTLPRVLAGAFGGSVIFFIVSNFGVWIASPMYPLTVEGLILCYTAAIPFFHNTLAGTLVYSGVLFGAYEYVKRNQPSLVTGTL
ncbi:MAG: DUF6580 family putative transport protein [Balneolaceae bacterium]